MNDIAKKLVSLVVGLVMLIGMLPLSPPASVSAAAVAISNDSIYVRIGDLGQIEELRIVNNPRNRNNQEINFVLPNNTSPQNGVQHQWMGEMIFSTRVSDTPDFPEGREGFVEVDTNKTLASGGSTTYSNINPNNPYISKTVSSDGKKVEVNFIGHDLSSTTSRAMKGFDVKSVFNADTNDGSLLWEITVKNKSDKYIEFGDIGLPMPWNNKYSSLSDTYNNRLTVHNFCGIDSGYTYAIRCSGEGNFILFTPVPESGARIEYVDYWLADSGELRSGSLYQNWQADQGGWFPGLNVLYIHSKDIRKTGRSYFKSEDATSLILGPGEEKTYQFKFWAVRAGDNTPGDGPTHPNNASNSMEEREKNLRSILYNLGMIDIVAVPSFQVPINMPALVDLHYDSSKIEIESIEIQSVYENDPYDEDHIPVIRPGQTREAMVNNSRAGRGAQGGNPGYERSIQFVETRIIDGEEHHIYALTFDTLGNNSLRIDYKLKVGEEEVPKFTQAEFNVLAELDEIVRTHSQFMVENTQDKDPSSPTYGIYRDWYLTTGMDTNNSHWGDDWSHDNANFMAIKNFVDPDPEEIRSLETYLIDFMWTNYMKNTQSNFRVANWLSNSGIFSTTSSPYVRTYSEQIVATTFFNMYRVLKAYPNLMEYRESPRWYLEKAYGIYYNRISSGTTGFYGEQQIPDMIEALREEGMMTEYQNLKQKFAYTKGRAMANATYPYGSEFEYDNTGEEGAYAASKALRLYYPEDSRAAQALEAMRKCDLKTRAMRGIQPTWFFYSVPVFRGGEGWWNFQYTASLAGSIMDDWLRYQDDGRTPELKAIAQQRNYAAKLSNFSHVNMGQISALSIGSTSWRFNAHKGGTGTKNVNDGGLRVMNNGWQDFSGESEEGLYGCLLRISADIITDPVFGLFGYGALVTDEGESYHIIPKDGFGRRINLINEKIYLTSENDKIESARIRKDGKAFELTLSNPTGKNHVSRITFDGAGIENGYYTIKLNGQYAGQFYVQNNKGVAMFHMDAVASAEVTVEKADSGENQAPVVYSEVVTPNAQALTPFMFTAMVADDGAPDGSMTYQWEVISAPEGASLSIANPNSTTTKAVGTKGGLYTVRFTANDGALSGSYDLTFELEPPPGKQPPVIGEVTAVQDVSNDGIIVLSGSATPDPLYNSELTYSWTVKEAPEGVEDVTIVLSNKETAYARISKAGTYVFTFTAIDEDKTASKDVSIHIAEDPDGSYRAISVITQKGTPPVLPGQIDILTDTGYASADVTWEAIDPESYAKAGEFTVRGDIEGTESDAVIRVFVVSKEAVNLALNATPSAIINTPSDLGGVTTMNDGYDPASSSDTSHGVWHNWHGNQGGPAWVMYTWDVPVLAYAMDVYVFRDGNGNFQPKDMVLTLRDENGNWYTPRALSGLGNALNRYNRTTFEPAYITGMRIDMLPVTLGCGIIEWKVYGYTDAVDRAELLRLNNYATSLDPSRFVGGLAPIADALAYASSVLQDKNATEDDVSRAVQKLLTDLRLLKPINNNMAFAAVVTASYTSSWERLSAVNDGKTSYHWGTWGRTSSEEWVQYEWPQGAKIGSTNLKVWNDGSGIKTPTKIVYSYIPYDSETDEWVVAATITQGIVATNNYDTCDNPYDFGKLPMIKAMRVTLTKPVPNSEGVGLWEWEVFTYDDPNRTAITGPSDIKPENTFTLGIDLVNIEGPVYAQDITLSYDPDKFEFVSATGADEDEVIIVGTHSPAAGSVRILSVTPGGASGDYPLMLVTFKAKEGVERTSSAISLSVAKVGRNDGSYFDLALSSFDINISHYPADKTALQQAIANARAVHDSAVEGDKAGQYPPGSKAVLLAAIQAAEAVYNEPDPTQEQVDSAVAALNAAVDVFRAKVREYEVGDLNTNNRIDIGDLAMVAVYFGTEVGDDNWPQAQAMDFNGDGRIGIEDLVYIALKILG